MARMDDFVEGPISTVDSWGNKRQAFYGTFPSGNQGALFVVKAGVYNFKSNVEGEIISLPKNNLPVKIEKRTEPVMITFYPIVDGVPSEEIVELATSTDTVHIPGGVQVDISCSEDFAYVHEIPRTAGRSEPNGLYGISRRNLRHANPIASSIAPGDVTPGTNVQTLGSGAPTTGDPILLTGRLSRHLRI